MVGGPLSGGKINNLSQGDLRLDAEIQAQGNGLRVAEFALEFETRLHLLVILFIVVQDAVHVTDVIHAIRGKPRCVRFARVDQNFFD